MACRYPSIVLSSDGYSGGKQFHYRPPKQAALLLVLLGGILLGVTAPGLAKDKTPQSRTVSGTVFDGAENPIPGAAVNLTDLQTGKAFAIYSQEDGQYHYADLRFDHDYTVQATYQGAASETRKVSMFDTRTHLVLNLTIDKKPSK